MNRNETLAEIRNYSARDLSNSDLADCGRPDAPDSAGALLLAETRKSFLTFIDDSSQAMPDDIRENAGEIVDGDVSIYTHQKWMEFVDLAAYAEEPEDGEWPSDLDERADAALYQILERMVYRFADMLAEAEAEDA